MSPSQLYESLSYVNSSKESRFKYALILIENPDLVKPCLEIICSNEDPQSARAAWILEYACRNELSVIKPHLDYFIKNMSKIKLDSAIRTLAKICELLCIAHYKNKNLDLSSEQKNILIESCFDWMITEQKVAVKAYSMRSLFLLGTDSHWIHSELKKILEKDFSKSSAAYKARAKHIFAQLKRVRS